MAVEGAIPDGISRDVSILCAKALLDFIIILVLTTTLGKGCIFSAIPIIVYQGPITLFAAFLEPLLTESALRNLSVTGSLLIFCVGSNILKGSKFPVANMLPTLVLAVLAAYLPDLSRF